jgi:hypothetical protein
VGQYVIQGLLSNCIRSRLHGRYNMIIEYLLFRNYRETKRSADALNRMADDGDESFTLGEEILVGLTIVLTVIGAVVLAFIFAPILTMTLGVLLVLAFWVLRRDRFDSFDPVTRDDEDLRDESSKFDDFFGKGNLPW